MALQRVKIAPGLKPDFTPTLNEGGWSYSQLIRFKDGLPQKMGGWQRVSSQTFVGTVRGVHAWDDLNGNPYFAGGSEQRLQVYEGGTLIDITPIRQTDNSTVNFSTVMNSATVTIIDNANGASVGDWVDIVVPVSVGGIIIQGLYQVQSVISGNSYTITASSPATSTVNNGGAVPSFSTTISQTNVSVTLANHGYSANSLFSVQVSTTVGGITMFGTYVVQSVTNANVFVISPGATASATTSGSENGGNAQFQYYVPTGIASATNIAGYGVGLYGQGLYGQGSSTTIVEPLRNWYLDNFGQNLVGNYNGSTLYQWAPPATLFGTSPIASNPAVAVTNAPTALNVSFVSNPQQMVIALGVENSGTGGIIDPNLVAWCDAGGINTWTAASNNQAGTYRIPTGSRLVGGAVMSNQVLIWTDLDLWTMQYIGLPFVWGFQKVSTDCGLISGHAMGILNQEAFWMGFNNFFTLNGSGAVVLECPVWDIVFKNLNIAQQAKIHCAVNSYFQEVAWFFPSASGTGEIDTYVKYNAKDKVWDYGSLVRTAWADESVFGPPIAVDGTGLMQQHEIGVDADGTPMMESIQTGYFDIADGEYYTFIERVIPDFDFAGSTSANPNVNVSVLFLEYPGDQNGAIGPINCGPYSVTPTTQSVYPRTRSRQAALLIQGVGLGTAWRLGAMRHNGQPDGKR
jgi:hypothetical protein